MRRHYSAGMVPNVGWMVFFFHSVLHGLQFTTELLLSQTIFREEHILKLLGLRRAEHIRSADHPRLKLHSLDTLMQILNGHGLPILSDASAS